ncbi:HD domain-containing protein 2 [Rhizophlyctis rosea]|nr:HD domain-containing protein 2 [Rhizophlyctis rosea]
MSDPFGVLEFLHICERLKTTKRTGWIDNKISLPESIADHMHRMGVMAMLLDDPTINKTHCIKMCIVHDLAESLVGDITPHAGVSKDEKFKLESDAMDKIVATLNNTPQAEEIRSLWREYEDAETKEALFVKDLDKFEMIVQAFEYEERHPDINLDSFFASTHGKFQHPTVKSWVEALYQKRDAAKQRRNQNQSTIDSS